MPILQRGTGAAVPSSNAVHAEGTEHRLRSWAKEASFDGVEKYRGRGKLFPIIVELRVFKTEEELEVLRYVTDVTCKAHMEVRAKRGLACANTRWKQCSKTTSTTRAVAELCLHLHLCNRP